MSALLIGPVGCFAITAPLSTIRIPPAVADRLCPSAIEPMPTLLASPSLLIPTLFHPSPLECAGTKEGLQTSGRHSSPPPKASKTPKREIGSDILEDLRVLEGLGDEDSLASMDASMSLGMAARERTQADRDYILQKAIKILGRNESPRVQEAAIYLLDEISDPRANGALLKIASSKKIEEVIREAARETLKNISAYEASRAILEKLWQSRDPQKAKDLKKQFFTELTSKGAVRALFYFMKANLKDSRHFAAIQKETLDGRQLRALFSDVLDEIEGKGA
jgi:HEAT repeat protein